MSQPPGSPEYYSPPPQQPPAVPPPPSISDAAAQYDAAQAEGELAGYVVPGYAAPAPGPAYPAGVYPAGAYATAGYSPPPGGRPRSGLAITALVLGLIALVTCWIPVWGAILGVAAIIFGGIAVAKRQPKGMATTGIVLGVLSAAVSILVTVILVRGLAWYQDDDWYSYGPVEPQATLGPASVDGGLAVAEQAFGASSRGDGTWWYVVIIDNPSDASYTSQDLTIRALDTNGAVLDESWTYVSLPSGRTAVAGNFWEISGGDVAALSVVGPGTGSLESAPQVGTLEISNLTPITDDYSTTVRGTVTSTLGEDIYGGTVAVVARDANGTIVGGAPGYFNALDVGESTSFDAYFWDGPLPEGTQFEAYWTAY